MLKFSRDLHNKLTILKDFLCLETVMFVYIGVFFKSHKNSQTLWAQVKIISSAILTVKLYLQVFLV